MVSQYMTDMSKTFGDLEVFQNLEKRSILMTPFFIFDDVIKKVASDQKIMHHLREPLSYFIDRQHFTMGIAPPDFNCMPCLEIEIVSGRNICFYKIYPIRIEP